MFKSRKRSIVIPQSEHLKLAGNLAYLWGNDDFDLPSIGRLSLTMGIGQHDRGYGTLDNSPVGEMPEAEWLEITRRGFFMACSDVNADLIIKHHLLRLAGYDGSESRKALTAEFQNTIQRLLGQHGYSAELFARIDRITNLCDSISLNFCREQAAEGDVTVFPKNGLPEQASVHYAVKSGQIRVNPWPFSVEDYSGYIIGYQQSGYPDTADPVILPFTLSKAG
jgi:Protein of unknown function (DUF3891)